LIAERDRVTSNPLADVPVAVSKQVDGKVFAYAADRRVVGIEILGAGKQINTELMKVIDFGAVKAA
jgi:hypothetical protein